MKVEFTSYGKLTIKPENHMENYALQKWANGYFSINAGLNPKEEVLLIEKMVLKAEGMLGQYKVGI